MGRYCQKAGNYKSFFIIMMSMIITPLWAAACRNPYGYMLVFVMSGFSVALMIVNFTTLLNFGEPERRHEYISFISVIKIAPIIIFTNFGGYLTDRYSPELTLVLSAVFCLVGLLVLVFKLGPLWRETEFCNTAGIEA
jgi:predicted MFS family arabinose efflux permease